MNLMMCNRCVVFAWLFLTTIAHDVNLAAQESGSVQGTVNFTLNSEPVHGAIVLIIGTGLVAESDELGHFQFDGLVPGTYELLAQREHLTAARQSVTVPAGGVETIAFMLELSPVHEELTVTTTAVDSSAFEAFNAINTLDSFDIATNIQGTIGEILQHQPGIAKRSFGPGTSRPIIRGFDGDRILIMQDGIRTGDLSAQSADHGVSIDPASLERLEIVRGPATLLYGSNAIGGVVNAITPHESFLSSQTNGLRGQVTTDVSSADAQAGGNGSVQYGRGQWQVWGGLGHRRTDDYDTPEGPILNSALQLSTGRVGLGYAGAVGFFSAGYQLEDGRYGIPFAGRFENAADAGSDEEPLIDADHQRYGLRIDVGAKNLDTPLLNAAKISVNYLDWHHEEIETADGREEVGTTFDNESIVVRAEIDQQSMGWLSGKFGVWSLFRDYASVGEEAITPRTQRTAFAAFAYEELDFDRYRVQLAGRLESNHYQVAPRDHGAEKDGFVPPLLRDRDFLGVSGSIGIQTTIGETGAVVANLTRSYRAPVLEELYNFGPHIGNLTFEIGTPDLGREASLGLELSVRHQSPRARGEFNFYTYDIDDFVFTALTGDTVDNLQVVEFLQGNSRFIGFDTDGSIRVHRSVWLNLGLGLVDAELSASNQPLPRIPPLHGRASADILYRGLSLNPELVWAAAQDNVFNKEAPTAGYLALNIGASYVWPLAHAAHIFSVRGSNLMNELYRNHTSFIKHLAPEIGRSIKVSYSLRFF